MNARLVPLASLAVISAMATALVSTPSTSATGGPPVARSAEVDVGTWTPEMLLAAEDVDPASFRMALTKSTGAATWLARSGGGWQVRVGVRTGAATWSVESLSAPGAMTAETSVATSSSYRIPPSNNAVVVAWRAFDGTTGGSGRASSGRATPGPSR